MLCIQHIRTYLYIVKSLNFIGTNSWFDDNEHVSGHLNSWILKLECNNTALNNYYVGILNSWIAIPTRYTKLKLYVRQLN